MLTFFSLFCCSIRRHRLCTYANHCFSPVVKFRSEVQQKKKKKKKKKGTPNTQHSIKGLYSSSSVLPCWGDFFFSCCPWLPVFHIWHSGSCCAPPPPLLHLPVPLLRRRKGFFFVQVKAASFLFCTVAHIFLCCFSFPLFLSSCYCCCCCEILARPHHDIVSPRLFLPSAPLFHRQLKF